MVSYLVLPRARARAHTHTHTQAHVQDTDGVIAASASTPSALSLPTLDLSCAHSIAWATLEAPLAFHTSMFRFTRSEWPEIESRRASTGM
jgi:hypothetical protein